jgi:hypothetical protein
MDAFLANRQFETHTALARGSPDLRATERNMFVRWRLALNTVPGQI